MKLELQRDHTGKLHATVAGAPLAGAYVKEITNFADIGLGVTIIVPLKDMTIGEIKNVIPMIRPEKQ